MTRTLRASLATDRMTDAQLWVALHELILRLDPRSLVYEPAKAHHLAVEAREVYLELRKRGTQLSLFPPAA